jgi:ABC-type multidrug transport system ATPase subunit
VAVGLPKQVAREINLLQNISLVIEPQEFVALVGVSGSGKSTLLGALSGLRPASKGDVLVNETSLYRNYEAFSTVLGYVPQDDILHRELPVERALRYTADLRLPDDTKASERETIINRVLADLALEQRRTVPVGRLSGGQRKRVSIGAELITRPGLFFLDEATSGLDPGTESQLMRLLRKLADDGHTIVLITHATKNVMLCDQVIFLAAGGNLAYFGPPDRALTYFGVSDFDQIYEKLETEAPAAWAERYRQSQPYAHYIEGRLKQRGLLAPAPEATLVQEPAAASGQAPPAAGRASALRQLSVLIRRYFDIMRRDRITLALVFLLAPVLGAVDLITWPRDNLDVRTGSASHSMSMLFIWALIPFLVGALSFVREIVKESAIYERERAVALGVWPYLLSKLLVAVPLAMYHAGALFIFKLIGADLSGLSPLHLFTLYGTLVLAVLSGVIFALLISTITSKEEQAMMLIIGVIVMQIVLSGGIVPLSSLGPPGAVVSKATSTSWSYKALATSVGVNSHGCSGDFSGCHLPGFAKLPNADQKSIAFANVDDSWGDVLDANIAVCWAAMGTIIVAVLTSLFVFQKRKDSL